MIEDREIRCISGDQVDPDLLEIRLLGIVFALWLELRGVTALHSTASVFGGRAAGFLGVNHAGKSTLAAALSGMGIPLLTDDLLAVDSGGDVLARPAYPQIRLRRRDAAILTGEGERWRSLHPRLGKCVIPVGAEFGTFWDQPAPLARLYLPQRYPALEEVTGLDAVRIEPLPRDEAAMALVRHAFIPKTIHALELHPHRLARVARIVREVPVRRLYYPSGHHHLPRVHDAILRDLALA
ncbi:MAG: hypothetical protein ACK47B_02990 [Armatimonadota bacterium]